MDVTEAPPVVSGRAEAADGFTAQVVAEAGKILQRELTDGVLERTRQAVLDWLGVCIAGSGRESATITRTVLKAEGGTPVARVFGTSDRLTARQAALVVGIAGHAMDYDDVGNGGHVSAAVLPGIFAVAQEIDADGRSTIEAMLYGYEAMSMVAAACGYNSYVRGFHWTGTFGAFGAALGVGRLLGLDPLRLQRALGIAGTQASGLRASFGTMSKHLHTGNAAAIGVLSARLAEVGYTGPTNIIEAPHGFAMAHNNHPSDFDPTRKGSTLGKRLAVEQIMFKSHAACAGTHSAIEGVRQLKEERTFGLEEVDEVVLHVPTETTNVCGIEEPTTGTEGMFSIRHAAALALIDASTGPSGFTTARVRDADVVAARGRIRVVVDAQADDARLPTAVKVWLKSGEVLETRVDASVVTPDQELPHQWERLEAKFRDLVEPILGPSAADGIVGAVRQLEALDSICELTEMTAA